MFNGHRYLPAVFLAAIALTVPACASQGGLYRYPTAVRVDNRVYDRGYEQGRKQGENDARRNRSFDYSRHDEYRRADSGYKGRDGNRNEYSRVFRQGFVAGYNDGYRRNASNTYGYPGYPQTTPSFPNRYPQAPVYRGGPGSYGSPAANNGYRDGYDQGRDDARHSRRFDPIIAKRYREGDHDYDRRYGSRDDYKRAYRAAFEQGYNEGYRIG